MNEMSSALPHVSSWACGFGAALRALRLSRGLALTELARKARCAKSHLSSLETGARRVPGGELLRRLEDELGVARGELTLVAELGNLGGAGRAYVSELERAVAQGSNATAGRAVGPGAQGAGERRVVELGAIPVGMEIASDRDLLAWGEREVAVRGLGLEGEGDLALRIADDAMSPEVAPGDVVVLGVVRRDRVRPMPGLCALACRAGCGVAHAVVVRRVEECGARVRLEPANVFATAVEVSPERVLWWARVVAHIRMGAEVGRAYDERLPGARSGGVEHSLPSRS